MKPTQNLVIITSVIHSHVFSAIPTSERHQQLLKSISSAQAKIPDNHIVIVEGSSFLTQEETDDIKKTGATLCSVDAKGLNKQHGECFLILSFFQSSYFQELMRQYTIKSIHKLSGRYYLTENFEFLDSEDLCVCKFYNPADWSGFPLYCTRYFAFPVKYLRQFLEGVQLSQQNLFINVEHSFFKYQALPFDKIDKTRTKINVAGYIGPSNEYIED